MMSNIDARGRTGRGETRQPVLEQHKHLIGALHLTSGVWISESRAWQKYRIHSWRKHTRAPDDCSPSFAVDVTFIAKIRSERWGQKNKSGKESRFAPKRLRDKLRRVLNSRCL
jgi:hypothetical protein